MATSLSKNEIRARAARFAEEYKEAKSEKTEAQSFQKDFFEKVLGVNPRRVATFEHRVKCLDGSRGYIDCFWKGHILVEMKSLGEDRQRAYLQAKRYTDTLPECELPRAILICDFQHWDFYDLKREAQLTSFTLAELPEHIELFFYLAGYERRTPVEEDPVNAQAAELMGQLHDRLKAIGYTGHPLEVYLVRLLFCLFADDTDIFERNSFHEFIQNCTAEDGHDLAPLLAELFQVMNTPEKERLRTRNEVLLAFPYVNGKLFAEYLPMPAFDAQMRALLLQCSALDWGKISPAIFGSMFQSVMRPEERRMLGAHYTSERNILKVINPLFMDALREEFASIRADKSSRRRARLAEFHTKLSRLTFLDPACGCGNFLVVAYRELRLLEMQVIKEQDEGEATLLENLSLIHVDQFYGIEIEEFPAHIAQVAMWLMDHQMNVQLGRHFGKPYVRIPLRHSAAITCGNALRLDWGSLVPREKLSYILGNPPFIGARIMSKEQKADLQHIFAGVKNAGDLDYVACWFKKAAELMRGSGMRAAFVSTNSIVQGQSVGILWKHLLQELGLRISFAYRTFKWSNEGKNIATVHCVIVGFGYSAHHERHIIVDEEGNAHPAKHINGYLTDAADVFVTNRKKPLCAVPTIGIGNKPIDGGNYLFTEEEKAAFIQKEAGAEKYFRPWLGARELLHAEKRYCLWLGDCSPTELQALPECRKRIELVRAYRWNSKSAPTRNIAHTPRRFHVENMPQGEYIAIPEVSSERRAYIPMSFLNSEVICSNLLHIIPESSLYHFGVLTSGMHMAWVRTVAGRLGVGYRYSGKIVYNNFPWPEPTGEQREKISALAQAVLDARALYPESSLAALYDPLAMPPELATAHRKLDAAVEKAYGRRFASDADRVAFLFERYVALCHQG